MLTRCSPTNHTCISFVRITSETSRSLVPSSPTSAAWRAIVRAASVEEQVELVDRRSADLPVVLLVEVPHGPPGRGPPRNSRPVPGSRRVRRGSSPSS